MEKIKVIDRVRNGKKVKFLFYSDKELWYSTEDGFEFPIPINEAGTGRFLAEDKASLFMRWIRKHMEMIEKSKEE